MSKIELEDTFVKCDCCEDIINMDKYGYYILQKGIDEEQVWCQECYESDLLNEMKKKDGYVMMMNDFIFV